MKKIAISIFVLFGYIFSFFPVHASNSSLLEEKLQTTPLGIYIPKIQSAISHATLSQLENIEKKLQEGVKKSESKEKSLLLYYFLFRVQEEMALQNQKIESISDAEKKNLEQEIITLQGQMKKTLLSSLESVYLAGENAQNYTENGEFTSDIMLDVGSFGNLEGKFNMSKYEANVAVFDQALNAHIDGFIRASFMGEDIHAEWESFVNFIMKDENLYLLFEKLDLKGMKGDVTFDTLYGDIIERLENLGRNGTYLKIPGTDTSLSPELYNGILSQETWSETTENIFEKPLFEAYQKKGNQYFLMPSEHFCSSFKKIQEIFDPFWGEECSESQLMNLQEKFKNGEQQLIYSSNGKKEISFIKNSPDLNGSIHFIFNDETIESIQGKFSNPNETQQTFDINYLSGNSLQIDMKNDAISFDFDAGIYPDGSIKEILFSGTHENSHIDFQIDRNKKMSLTIHGEEGENHFTCQASGNIEPKFLDISGKCMIHHSQISFIFPEENDVTLPFFIKSDARYGQRESNISVSASVEKNKNFFSLQLFSKAYRKAEKKEILAPENTIEFEDFLESEM